MKVQVTVVLKDYRKTLVAKKEDVNIHGEFLVVKTTDDVWHGFPSNSIVKYTAEVIEDD